MAQTIEQVLQIDLKNNDYKFLKVVSSTQMVNERSSLASQEEDDPRRTGTVVS